MRILLISDTHGELSIVNKLVAAEDADCVIHAGDFGFYEDESLRRLSQREIWLIIKHAHLPRRKVRRILELGQRARVKAVEKYCLLGGFQRYLAGKESFDVPVYAVWGNHDDGHLVERLVRGRIAVPNLRLLHSQRAYRVGPALVYGLGGNFLPGQKMLDQPIAGRGGKIWSTLSEFSDLVQTVDSEGRSYRPRIFVSHVSPRVEPFVEYIGTRTGADYTVSGHMAPPACDIWTASELGSLEEAERRVTGGIKAVRKALRAAKGKYTYRDGLQLDAITVKAGGSDWGEASQPRWYERLTHVNLPDADVGYALMDVESEGATLRSRALGASAN